MWMEQSRATLRYADTPEAGRDEKRSDRKDGMSSSVPERKITTLVVIVITWCFFLGSLDLSCVFPARVVKDPCLLLSRTTAPIWLRSKVTWKSPCWRNTSYVSMFGTPKGGSEFQGCFSRGGLSGSGRTASLFPRSLHRGAEPDGCCLFQRRN